MPRDLFGNVTDPSIKVGSRKWYTVPLSLAVHSLVLLALIVVPLLATGALPLPHDSMAFVPVARAPLPAPPPAPRAKTDSPPVNREAAPLEAPNSITKEAEVDFGFESSVDGGIGVEELGVIQGTEAIAEPPPPPPAQPRALVRPGRDIQRPEKILDAAPIYPTLALMARREGSVIIEAIISTDGHVQNARVLRSVPLLDDAALAAVRQWIYTPSRLNGEPVSVIMTVTVHFRLQ